MALFDKRLENHTASAKIENMGQEERMNSLLKTMTRSLIIGGMVLMMSIGVNLWVTLANGARLEMLQALDQYRIGSKNLSFAAQAYAVTGKQHYLDRYEQESKVDMNKEKALAILKDSDVKEAEGEEQNRIIAEEESMVPMEAEAIELAKSGKTTELIETTIQAVEKGISIADKTTESMVEVMQGAMVATQKMGEIAEMLNNEVAGIQAVNSTIATVTEVTDSNSATSQETAAVSEEQKAQVESMVQLMEFFEI